VHIATMEEKGIRRILSTDRDFDDVDAIERVDPSYLA
jgi:predicted nucleic acid-binding protein